MKSWNPSRSAFVVLLTGSVLASQVLRWLGAHGAFTALAIPEIHFHSRWEYFLAGVALTVGFASLTFLASGTRRLAAWNRNFVYAGYAYLPLAFLGLFDIYIGQFISRGYEIPRLLAKLLGFHNVTNWPQATSILAILQGLPPLLALVGGALSLYLLRKLRVQYGFHSLSYRLHQMLILITCLVFLMIF